MRSWRMSPACVITYRMYVTPVSRAAAAALIVLTVSEPQQNKLWIIFYHTCWEKPSHQQACGGNLSYTKIKEFIFLHFHFSWTIFADMCVRVFYVCVLTRDGTCPYSHENLKPHIWLPVLPAVLQDCTVKHFTWLSDVSNANECGLFCFFLSPHKPLTTCSSS